MKTCLRLTLLALASTSSLLALSIDAGAAADVIIRGDCDPRDFRPSEPTIVVCEMEVENTGDTPVPEARIMFGLAPGLPTPTRFYFFAPGGNPPGPPPPSIELGTLAPGEVASARTVMLLENASAGKVGGSAIVMEGAKGTQHAQATMSFDVRPDAVAPSRGLNIKLIMEESSGYAEASETPYATISIEVHNRSTEAVRDVVVTHIAPAEPHVTWISSATEVPGIPPGFQRPPMTPYTTVEWRIPVLAAGESRYFHGLIEKSEPAMVTHSVLGTGTDSLGSEVLAGAVEQWSYAACSLPQVDCFLSPTATPAATLTPVPTPEQTIDGPDSSGGGESDDGPWTMIAFLWGGAIFLGISLGFLARRRRS